MYNIIKLIGLMVCVGFVACAPKLVELEVLEGDLVPNAHWKYSQGRVFANVGRNT